MNGAARLPTASHDESGVDSRSDTQGDTGADPSADIWAVATLLAVDPAGLGGVVLRCAHGPDRDAWLAQLRALLPPEMPQRRMAPGTADAALLGGLDFVATLQAGRPVVQQGLLAQCDGGLLTLAMAERLTPSCAARLAVTMDTGVVALERDGLALRVPARVGLVALDEGLDDDEQLPAALRERMAFRVEAQALRGLSSPLEDAGVAADDGAEPAVQAARERLRQVTANEDILQALCAAASALGVDSMRAPMLALRAARAAAAWDGRLQVSVEDAALAARLVLAHRATRLPVPADSEAQAGSDAHADAPEAPDQADAQSAEPPRPPDPSAGTPQAPHDSNAAEVPPPSPPSPEAASAEAPADLSERVVEAARAAIPPGLLALLAQGAQHRARAMGGGGRAGALHASLNRGRPIGARKGEPRGGARLHVLDTLRAAAPWQPIRARQANAIAGAAAAPPRIHLRREDFHVTRYKQRSTTTTIFVVDASGSSALHRLAEAKGAVEVLLADCYVRRDRVAVLGFRGQGAELLLPPTRSLARARRSLAGLPGGGGTPLASALDATRELVESLRRAGDQTVVVLLTDGRANIARDGSPGRQRANEDALAAAGALRALGASSLLLDTSPQPQPTAQAIAQRMGATYLPLPHADARAMSGAVRLATGRR